MPPKASWLELRGRIGVLLHAFEREYQSILPIHLTFHSMNRMFEKRAKWRSAGKTMLVNQTKR
jgi:hypothetical protein